MSTPVPAREGEGGGEPVRARSLRIAFLMPLVVFLALAALFFARLWHGDDPSEIPSALIGKPVPAFVLPPVEGLTEEGQPVPGFSNADLGKGEVTLVNVWGSWCLPCREEHPFLAELAARGIKIYGINQKDVAENARRFLGALGNPFTAVGADPTGRVSIDWGVYGVPETFVVDGSGRIAYKHIGPLTQRSIEKELMPQIRKAQAEGAPSG